MLRQTSIYLAPNELRRDQRFVAPPVSVLFGAARYAARNWSMGGILLDGAPAIDIGERVEAHLLVEGWSDRFAIMAEALRRDDRAGTLACRFIEPSPILVEALDRAIAARLVRAGRRQAGVAMAIVGALLAMAAPAKAAGTGALVPGAAPLPEFRLNFPNLLAEPLGPPSLPGDLSIALTQPDKSVIEVLFSPRSRFGMTSDPQTGTSRTYAGLSWNLFDDGGFFGNLGLAGSLTRPGNEDYSRNSWRYFGPSLALHSTFEIGYNLGGGHSLTLSLDRASEPSFFTDRYELDNFRLNYGLKF